jgi:putative salt-induced outer membrane protein YdiY
MKQAVRGSLILLLTAGVFATGAFGQQVTFELKNGDRITGQIISENTNRVVLSNSWARDISIPLADVSKRTVLAVPAAATNAVAAAKPSGSATNVPPKTNGVALAKAVAATNAFFTSPLLRNWHGDLLVGADLTFSERNRQVYNAKAKLTYAKDRLKNILDYNMTYGRSELIDARTKDTTTVTDANRMDGSMKTDFDLTKKWYVYNLGGAGFDEIRKIDLRYELGPGMGYHLIQRTNFFLNTEVGVNFQVEERSDGTENRRFFHRFAENATWKITPRLTWDEKFEYFPRFDDFGEFRLRFESNLRYALLQNIFVNLSVIDLYDSAPAKSVTENDLQFRSSIGLKF